MNRATFALGTLAAAASLVAVSLPAAATGSMRFGDAVRRFHNIDQFDGIVSVSRGGHRLYRGGIGFANRERRVLHDPDETFRLASVTKQFTALLIVQEVERGNLDLDAPIGRVLSTLPAASAAITVRQLLNNASGLPNLDTLPGAYTRTDAPLDDLPRYVAELPAAPLAFVPGTSFAYNNLDFIVAGAVLQRVTGKTFATLVRERIIEKLALRGTGVYGDVVPDDHVHGYELDGDRLVPETIGRLANFGPAGAMYSTLADMQRWNHALLRYELVGETATRAMFAPNARLGFVALGSWSYDLRLPADGTHVHLIERQGNIGGVQVLNVISFERELAMTIVANTDRADLFKLYVRGGLPYALVTLAAG